MIELLLAAIMVGQEVTFADEFEGHPIEMCWRANIRGNNSGGFCDKYCGDIPPYAPAPACRFIWSPTEAGTWEVTLVVYYLHHENGGNRVSTHTNIIEVEGGSIIFLDGFESGDIGAWEVEEYKEVFDVLTQDT